MLLLALELALELALKLALALVLAVMAPLTTSELIRTRAVGSICR